MASRLDATTTSSTRKYNIQKQEEVRSKGSKGISFKLAELDLYSIVDVMTNRTTTQTTFHPLHCSIFVAAL